MKGLGAHGREVLVLGERQDLAQKGCLWQG